MTMDFRYGTLVRRRAARGLRAAAARRHARRRRRSSRARDEVEAAWPLIIGDPRGVDDGAPPPFPNYDAGTWGPERAHELMARDGRTWRRLRTR